MRNVRPWLLLIVFSVQGLAAQAKPQVELPALIVSNLDSAYPGWNLAPISKLLVPADARDKYTNLMFRDLDADGEPDYALSINFLDSQDNVRNAALVFLQRGKEYKEYSLSENWLGAEHRLVFAPGDTALHWVR
jgi:hypothetical protein